MVEGEGITSEQYIFSGSNAQGIKLASVFVPVAAVHVYICLSYRVS